MGETFCDGMHHHHHHHHHHLTVNTIPNGKLSEIPYLWMCFAPSRIQVTRRWKPVR